MKGRGREMANKSKRWTIWKQHWVGCGPRKFGSYETEQEAESAVAQLNDSPSGQWFHYIVPPRDGEAESRLANGAAQEKP